MIAYHAWVQETVVTLLLNVVMLRDPEEWAKSVANDERAFARAITFSNIIVLNFGCEPYADCPSSEVLGQPGCGFSGGLASSGLEI